jgi:hypothetical protein
LILSFHLRTGLYLGISHHRLRLASGSISRPWEDGVCRLRLELPAKRITQGEAEQATLEALLQGWEKIVM